MKKINHNRVKMISYFSKLQIYLKFRQIAERICVDFSSNVNIIYLMSIFYSICTSKTYLHC